MSTIQELWDWLSKPETQTTLKFIGGGLATLVAALWALYKFRAKTREVKTPTPGSGISAGQNLIVGGHIIIVQITPEQTENLPTSQLGKILAELPTVDPSSQELLIKKLETIKAKYAKPNEEF